MAEKTTAYEHALQVLNTYYGHGMRNDAVDLAADARQLLVDLAPHELIRRAESALGSLIHPDAWHELSDPTNVAELAELVARDVGADSVGGAGGGETTQRDPDRSEGGLDAWDVGALAVVLDRRGNYPDVRLEDEGHDIASFDRITARLLAHALACAAERAVPPALLAVGDTVETAEQLDALPERTWLETCDGDPVVKNVAGWFGAGIEEPLSSKWLLDQLEPRVARLPGGSVAAEPEHCTLADGTQTRHMTARQLGIAARYPDLRVAREGGEPT